mgnify:FL=1
MSTIRILSDQVANRIAAGEVVERPVAVIKELVENSIDAGATRIRIAIQKGGKSLMRVEDNGCGMSPDDAMMCIERHATSKIQSSDDLFNIRTLGFRGEAIPSIASVSRFLLQTRAEGFLEGTEILINGGKLIHSKSVGMPTGTRIEVTHLFSSVPARRKFLKTDNTEASHIIQTIRMLAVAHPGIGFTLHSSDRSILSVPEGQDVHSRILSLWGGELSGNLLPLKLENSFLSGHGFIGSPGFSRPTRHDIVTIVNGRPVESRTLGFALTEACHTHIPRGRYPIAFLYLEVDPASIDVNIHPSKKEIKFKDEGGVRSALIQAVWKTFGDAGASANTSVGDRFPEAESGSRDLPVISGAVPYTDPIWPPPMRDRPASVEVSFLRPDHKEYPASQEKGMPAPNPNPPPPASAANRAAIEPLLVVPQGAVVEKKWDSRREWRYIGHFNRVYSVFERDSGLTLLHAPNAFRRVRYDKVLGELERSGIPRQGLVIPVCVELDLMQDRAMKAVGDQLVQFGLGVSEFGRRTFRIEEIPAWIESSDAKSYFTDILAWLGAGRMENELRMDGEVRREAARLIYAHSSSNADYPLSPDASHHLLESLLACRDPLSSPEGKPTMVHLPHRYFDHLVNPGDGGVV